MTSEMLTKLIQEYRHYQQQQDRIQLSKDITKAHILRLFEQLGVKEFATENLRAALETRTTRSIAYKQAAKLLPRDLLQTLTVERTSEVFSVREVKATKPVKEAEAYIPY